MEFVFTGAKEQKVPYFEDATPDIAPYYTSTKTPKRAQDEIRAEMAKLGAAIIAFDEGYFGEAQRRYGYRVRFFYAGKEGLIRVAGLPLRKENPKKKDAVLTQALLNVRDWLKAAVTAQVFAPGSDILIPHLLVDGEHTIADYIIQENRLLALNPPPQQEAIVKGEIVS